MRRRRLFLWSVLPMLVALLLTACGTSSTAEPTEGQVIGVLVSESDKKPSDVALKLVAYQGDLSNLPITLEEPCAIPDGSGAFRFTDVSPGEYVISLIPTPDCRALPTAVFVEDGAGKTIIVELKAGQGVDLGKILVSNQ